MCFNDGRDWSFTAVYVSPQDYLRRTLWTELMHIASSLQGEWLVAGDFNDIASPDEKKGGVVASQRKCSLFLDRINAYNLLDLGAVGAKFTWRGPLFNGHSRIFERLDRALCNNEWRFRFPNAVVRVLPRVTFSDHHPLLIFPHGMAAGPALPKFRFENAWVLHPSYHEIILQNWSNDGLLDQNLKNLEAELSI